MTLIDTHAHLYYDQMYNNLDTVLDEATEKLCHCQMMGAS